MFSVSNLCFLYFSLRIFGHQIDENNPSQISEVAEGDENGDDKPGKVSSRNVKTKNDACFGNNRNI